MVRGELLRCIEKNGDGACGVSEVVSLSARPPLVGTSIPSFVALDFVVSGKEIEELSMSSMKKGAVLILTTIDSLLKGGEGENGENGDMEVEEEGDGEDGEEVPMHHVATTHGIGLTRISVVQDIMDEDGNSYFDQRRLDRNDFRGQTRTIRVHLPPDQYSKDIKSGITNYSFRHVLLGHDDVRTTYHLVRRLGIMALNVSSKIGGGVPPLPAWLRETIVQGRLMPTEMSLSTDRDSKYDMSKTFRSLKQVQTYLEFVKSKKSDGGDGSGSGSGSGSGGSGGSGITYEDEDDEKEVTNNDSKQFQTRFLLPSRRVEVYYSDVQNNVNGSSSMSSNNNNNKTYNLPDLDSEQVHFVLSCLTSKDGLTILRGGPGSGKSEAVAHLVAALSRHPDERVLLLSPTVGSVDRLLSKLERGHQVKPRHLLRMGGSGHGYGHFGPYGRREHCQRRQRQILSRVSILSESLGVTEHGVQFTCETAGHFYSVHVHPRINIFLTNLEINGGAMNPFEKYFQQIQRGSGGKRSSSEQIIQQMDQMTEMFHELRDYSPFEWMPFARHQISYLETTLSKVVGASIDDMVRTLYKYDDDKDVDGNSSSGPSFTTIVVDGASHVSEAALAVILAYNRNKTRRVVLTGDLNTSTVVPSSFSRATSDALYVGAKMNTNLFQRLTRAAFVLGGGDGGGGGGGGNAHTLSTHHRSRPGVLDLYKWRYKSTTMTMTSNSGGSQQKKKYLANTGLRYVSQFINVNEGHELSCPLGGYQNLEEAEYVVSMYQYLRLLGHPGRSIVILTTYEEQSNLMKDIMNLRCVDSPHFGKPNDVTVSFS